MYITVNKTNNTITGSYNNIQYGVPYTEEVYTKLMEIAEKANQCTSVALLNDAFKDFDEIVIMAEDINTFIQSKVPNVFRSNDGHYYLESNKVISSIPMPAVLVKRLEDTMDKDLDPLPLIKFWTRFLRNPKLRKLDKDGQLKFSEKVFNYVNIKYTNQEIKEKLIKKGFSEEIATEQATVDQVQITMEGLLKTFKVSKEITKRFRLNDKGERESYDVYESGKKSVDEITGLITYEEVKLDNEARVFKPAVQGDSGDAFYCKDKLGHLIRVGQVHKLPDWTFINCDDDRSCVKGLHVGNIDYIKGYQNDDTCTHNILVDPTNIGAVPDDSTGAIRCVEYFVLDEFSGINGSLYHSSSYAAQTDAAWSKMREEAIKHFGELKDAKIKKINKETNELNSL